jgi:tetratricopeptide (TPR) repeat protein
MDIYLERAIDFLNKHNTLAASELFELSLNYPNCYLSSNIGLIYSYILMEHSDRAKKYYDNLLIEYPKYEPYFFPVHAMIKENRITQAENIIDSWLKISPQSHQANLYKIKVLSCSPMCLETQYSIYLNKISDEKTYFEKSYVMVDCYLKLHQYDKAIGDVTKRLK